MISVKSHREIEKMKKAAVILKSVLAELENAVNPEVTTKKLDDIAEKCILAHGAIPSFKNYHGYPASICSSVNDEVVHGIPSKRKLCAGDIVSIDVGVYLDGYHVDAARTWAVGKISQDAQALITATRESFYAGIQGIKAGLRLGDISASVQTYVEKRGYAVVRDFVGHGIGQNLHEDPQVPNFGKPGTGPKLESGMTLAIEPMVNAGTWEVTVHRNKWTVQTKDGALSAHYENTVVIGEKSVEVLT